MATRKFEIEAIFHITLTLDEQVINVVDDEWRSQLYDLNTPEEIAEHITYNLLNGNELSQLDGWANQPNSNAQLTINDILFDDTEEWDR